MTPFPIELLAPDRVLGQMVLEGNPQPGQCIEVDGIFYRILERRHCYHLKKGKYHLHKAVLRLQPLEHQDLHLWQGQWVIGNPECKYNARSELLRCAVNPNGVCSSCPHFERF